MLFATPTLTTEERGVLDQVEELRGRLGARTRDPRAWVGLLRRTSLARAIQGSNRIAGYNTSIEDAFVAVDDDEPAGARDGTWRATVGYRDAMNYVLQLADDLHFELDTTRTGRSRTRARTLLAFLVSSRSSSNNAATPRTSGWFARRWST